MILNLDLSYSTKPSPKNLFNNGLVSGISWKRTETTSSTKDVTLSPMVVGNRSGNTGFWGCAYTTATINITGYSSLKATYYSQLNNTKNKIQLGISTSNTPSSTGAYPFTANGTYSSTTSSITVTYDISSYNGNYYVALQNYKDGRVDNACHYVTKVWLE